MELEKTTEDNYVYAGFWPRVGAFVIDWFIVILIGLAIAELVTFSSLLVLNYIGASTHDFVEVKQYPVLIGTYVGIIVDILYFSIMDSSKYRATVGKRIFKLQIEDNEQKRISFWRSLIRFLVMWPIPFLLAGQFALLITLAMALTIPFTIKKQSVYDIITGCLVIKKYSTDAIIDNHLDERETNIESVG